MGTTQARPRGLRVRFAYANADEFVTTYAYYCDQDAVFAPTDKLIPVESECAFSLELSDGSPMLRGLGVILECWGTDDNRFGRRGVYIGFSQLTTTSQALHKRMLALRKLEEEESTEVTQIPTRTRGTPDTVQQFGTRRSTAQIATPDVEETDDGEMKRSITREMAAVADPSIPMAIEDNRANATSRYEGLLRGPAIPAKPRAQSPVPVSPSATPGIAPMVTVPGVSLGALRTPAVSASAPAVAPPATPASSAPVAVSLVKTEPLVAIPKSIPRSTGQSAPLAPSRTPTGQSLPLAASPAASSPTAPLVAIAAAPLAAASPVATTVSGGVSSALAAASSFGVSPETAETRPEGRGSNQPPPLPPVPPTRPSTLARGSSPAPLHEQLAEAAAALPPSAAPNAVSGEATEPIVADTWQDKVSQIRERAHEAAQRAWRRAHTTAASGLHTVRSEASIWRASPRTAAKRWKPTRRAMIVFAGGILAGLILSLIVRAKPTAPAAAPPPKTAAALLPQPPIAQCKEAPKPDTSIAALATPVDATPAIATPPHHGATSKAMAKSTRPTANAKTASSIAKAPSSIAKAAPATKTASTAKTATTASPTTIAKTAPPATKAAAPSMTKPTTTVAKTAATTTTTKAAPTALATPTTKTASTAPKTTSTTTKAAPPAASPPTTKVAPTTVAKTTAPTTKSPSVAAPAQKTTSVAKTKSATTSKTPKPCTGLECI